MRSLSIYETKSASGGIWCTYEGQACSGCANLIEISGDDCSIIQSQLSINTRKFDTGSVVMGIAATWVGFVVSYGSSSLGLSVIASGGIGVVLGVALCIGYIAAH